MMHRRTFPLAVAFVLVAWLCVFPAAQAPAPSAPAPLRERVQAYLDEWRAASSFPGVSVGVVLADGSAFGVVSGVADRAAGTSLKVEDLFLAGSTGKTFFAAVAVQLIEQGRLDLDAPISKYLGAKPWFPRLPNAKTVTVRHLMTHTSGIVRYEMDPKFTADAPQPAGQDVDARKRRSRSSSTRRRRSPPARAGTTPTPTTSSSA